MWNRIVRMMQNAFKFNEPKILPGRWKLKYTETELDRFYRQIPDPGYTNDY